MNTLFEVSWEVCNKVGGIHTVLSTKARTLVERLGDRYVAIGPWQLANRATDAAFEDEPGFEAFAESCRELGVPVRVGRWRIPGRPRAILVEFSGLFEKKDIVLARLWEDHAVDSLTGGWDYVEPVMFGHAAGLVIERWWQDFVAPERATSVAQFHEWMTGSGLLHLKTRVPSIGTVFTTHATMLGRAMSAHGHSPEDGLGGRTPEGLAHEIGVTAKHSMEGVCAREADVFTTVSGITAAEAELLHGRKPEPVLPNGIDLGVVDELCGDVSREEAGRRLRDLAQRALGADVSDALLVCVSGRYEFYNKGIDLLLDSLALVDQRPGRPIVLFAAVPAGNSGLGHAMLQRLRMPLDELREPLPDVSTHNLFDPDGDPIRQRCAQLGLDNAAERRVKVVHVPIYLHPTDGVLDMSYEAALRAMDLSAFPSFYEPWGYTPQESLAVGVPSVTTDRAGFGRWASEAGIGPADGVYVLGRVDVEDRAAAELLAGIVDGFAAEPRDREETVRTCRATAERTSWSDLIANYDEAFDAAVAAARPRSVAAGRGPFRAQVALPVAAVPEGARPRLAGFEVKATLPEALRPLERLARNYWWAWDRDARALFEELSPQAWEKSGHNPVHQLQIVFREDLDVRARDEAYVARVTAAMGRLDAYLRAVPDGVEAAPGRRITGHAPVAYFCAEFGVHESLRIYSGGLGILAGDHLKSASDLGLPLVAVGLFYRRGYLKQRVTGAGDQIALDAANDPARLALEPVLGGDGRPIEVVLDLPSSRLVVRAWRARVGRVALYLLDTDVPANRPEDREITQQLYGGDHEARLRQEIVLGRAGVRLLEALGLEPSAWHANEGHAAFMTLERVGRLIATRGYTFDEARGLVQATTAFTTHTPVPAGHDRFSEDLLRRYFSDAPAWIGVPWERFIALGHAEDDRDSFNMTYLALAFAGFVNGVSQLHGEVSRKLLGAYWPRLVESERPVAAITNGVHLPTWTHGKIAEIVGAEERPVCGRDFAERGGGLDAAALWEAKRAAKREMLGIVRGRLQRAAVERNDRPRLLERSLERLEEDVLIVGFARRFAPYKRAGLLLKDRARLRELLEVPDRPLCFLIAGKAHPRDGRGLEILKQIFEVSRSDEFIGRIVFLDDYDVELGRSLVQGVDVWLNNPIRGLEASGTSGMKVAANAGLNLSVQDGWWLEGYDGENGWSIGDGRTFQNQDLQDELDRATLHQTLLDDVLPEYYERDERGLPQRWIERMRRNLASLPAVFDSDRMVGEYLELAYRPLAARGFALEAGARTLLTRTVGEVARLRRGFSGVRIAAATLSDLTDLRAGDPLRAKVEVVLGELSAADVVVELVLGRGQGADLGSRAGGQLADARVVPLELAEDPERGAATAVFAGGCDLPGSGSFAYGLRIRARAPESPATPGDLADLVLWA